MKHSSFLFNYFILNYYWNKRNFTISENYEIWKILPRNNNRQEVLGRVIIYKCWAIKYFQRKWVQFSCSLTSSWMFQPYEKELCSHLDHVFRVGVVQSYIKIYYRYFRDWKSFNNCFCQYTMAPKLVVHVLECR